MEPSWCAHRQPAKNRNREIRAMQINGMPRVSPTSTRLKVISHRLRATIQKQFGRPFHDELSTPELIGSKEPIECPATYFEKGQLHRILACGFNSPIRDEIAGLEAGSQLSTPRERFHLGESILVGGTIINGRSRHFLRTMSELRGLCSAMEVHGQATLLNSMQGLYYFGHWLQDDCALYEAVRDAPVLLSMVRPDWPDRHFYERAFQQTWVETKFAHVGDLTIWRDLGYSAEKASRIRHLRERLRNAVPARAKGKIIYLSRGRLGEMRNMSNSAAFESALRAAGIDIIEPGRGAEELMGARLVISIEGSQACHGLYTLAEGGAFLILQPPERFYNPLRKWAALLGMNYGIVVGEKDDVSYRINPDEVLYMVDRLLAADSG
jgi:hypothetical protein